MKILKIWELLKKNFKITFTNMIKEIAKKIKWIKNRKFQ